MKTLRSGMKGQWRIWDMSQTLQGACGGPSGDRWNTQQAFGIIVRARGSYKEITVSSQRFRKLQVKRGVVGVSGKKPLPWRCKTWYIGLWEWHILRSSWRLPLHGFPTVPLHHSFGRIGVTKAYQMTGRRLPGPLTCTTRVPCFQRMEVSRLELFYNCQVIGNKCVF